jgi:hypothetical protein
MTEVIVMVGIAMFFVLLSAMFYLIFKINSVSGTVMIVIGTIMIAATGIAASMAISSSIAEMNKQPTYINISKISLCDNFNMPCAYSVFPDSNNVTVYWEVTNGIGCCASYNCNYTQFANACLIPTFKIYDIYLDNIKTDWSGFNISDYNYTCSNNTPYQFKYFNNVSLGVHTIKIEQKDCTKKILAKANITFVLAKVDDVYTLEVIQ